MTMPFRPVRVVGGLRLWLATFFTVWVKEGAGRCGGNLLLVPRGRRPAEALMASVNESQACSASLSRRDFGAARPERFVECGDLFCRRTILLGLRDAPPAL